MHNVSANEEDQEGHIHGKFQNQHGKVLLWTILRYDIVDKWTFKNTNTQLRGEDNLDNASISIMFTF